MIRIYAPGKINIGLQIGSRQSDGYHYIETFIQTVDFTDCLEIEESSRLSFQAEGYEFPANEENLCMKAYKAFASHIRTKTPVRIKLYKKIPVGAGLGGGSSDAAAVIYGLNQLWNTGLDVETLASIAIQIGADVPFFLKASEGSAICGGCGEEVIPHPPLFKGWAVIIFTGLHISTAWAYKNFDQNLTNKKKIINLKNIVSKRFPAQKGLNFLINDFSEIIFRKYCSLHEITLALDAQGASYSSLSGSGSAVYGLFQHHDAAVKALEALPGYQLKIAVKTPAPNYL